MSTFEPVFDDMPALKRLSPSPMLVRGNPGPADQSGVIELSLDGKPAQTEYRMRSYDPDTDTARLDVVMKTGRLHQIRRHLDMIGDSVMGDPRYGRNNKNKGACS